MSSRRPPLRISQILNLGRPIMIMETFVVAISQIDEFVVEVETVERSNYRFFSLV